MNNEKFIKTCKRLVAEYANKHLDKCENATVDEEHVHVVWLNKTLQNNKAILTTMLFDGMYYELTYDGDEQKMYFDVYKKVEDTEYNIKFGF